MYQKLLLAMGLLLLCQFSFADTCPSIKDIQAGKVTGWKLFDSEDDTPLPAERIISFKKNAERFALAEWAGGNKKKGAIHCFYRNKSGSDLEAYLAKDNFSPENSHDYWYQVSGYMHCAAGMDKCVFQSAEVAPQLAKK